MTSKSCYKIKGDNQMLTTKQQIFVNEYLVDCNATQAAIRAGYSKRTANRTASENLSKPVIQSAIEKAKQERSMRTQIDADYVLKQTAEFLEYCFGKKPIKKTIMLDGIAQTIEVEEFNHAGVGKALELLGKHVGVQAFNKKQELKASIYETIETKFSKMSSEEMDARIKELNKKLSY